MEKDKSIILETESMSIVIPLKIFFLGCRTHLKYQNVLLRKVNLLNFISPKNKSVDIICLFKKYSISFALH